MVRISKRNGFLLGAITIGLIGSIAFKTFQKNRGLFEFDSLCVTNVSTTCSYHWNYRLIDGKWVETYAQGKTLGGFIQTVFGKPYRWWFVVSHSGDDWSQPEETYILTTFSRKGHSKILGDFESELKKEGDEWHQVVTLSSRGEKIELTGRWIYRGND
jgi:hypothetical protein